MATEHTDTQANRNQIIEAFHLLIKEMGDDPKRVGLERTPERMFSAFGELTSGYKQDPISILGTQFQTDYDQMVVVVDIPFVSLCEHHLMPFWGTISLGYLPKDGRVVGLSKLPRLVRCLSRRFQIQERLTQEIATSIDQGLSPLGVGVVTRAVHSCMKFRGVRSHGEMRTSTMLGAMLDEPEARSEFLALIS